MLTYSFKYTDVQLFNQLRYFAYLFDGEKAKQSASGSSDSGGHLVIHFSY